jgi:hypothetical protein
MSLSILLIFNTFVQSSNERLKRKEIGMTTYTFNPKEPEWK